MANILNANLLSSLGDTTTTLDAIKKSQTNISKKSLLAIEGRVDAPYALFRDEVEDSQEGIYSALKSIVEKSIAHLSQEDRAQTAIIVGTSVIDWNVIDAVESTLYEYKRTPYYSKKTSIDTYAKELTKEFDLNGFSMTINTACTSSVNAILEASNLVDSELYKYVVVVGLEVFSDMMSTGFYAMQLLSESTIKPFDEARDGMVLGEALACLLIGSEASEWEIKGGFSNCNGVNITAVSEEGDEFKEVMLQALTNANTNIDEITALKAHATGTYSNDLSEMNALSNIFSSDLIFTTLKPYVGHTIGACGALEVAIFMSCIDDGFIPKSLNHKESIKSEYQPLLEHKACSFGTFMFNYFGFGGNNTSLILKKEQV
jgi:3-oxoacyl-[acyl-carrier-protein] synthase-1